PGRRGGGALGEQLLLRPRQPARSLQIAARGAGPPGVPRPAARGRSGAADRRDRPDGDFPHEQGFRGAGGGREPEEELSAEGGGPALRRRRREHQQERGGLQTNRAGSDRLEAVSRGGQEPEPRLAAGSVLRARKGGE